jgi:hypothetical protein
VRPVRLRGILIPAALLLATLVAAGTVAFTHYAGGVVSIDRYTVTGSTVTVSVEVGEGTWTRVTGVDEGDREVRITVRSFTPPLPMAGLAIRADRAVLLRQPLGDRRVVDGTGQEVHRD